jgi:hypothetical protein
VTRRFVLLAGVLVTLNVVLFFAGPGLALRSAVVSELFGPKMVRLTVLERNGQEWNVDRGTITQISSTQVTLRESDGRVQQIPLDSTTDVLRFGRQISESAPALARARHLAGEWCTGAVGRRGEGSSAPHTGVRMSRRAGQYRRGAGLS